MQLQDLLGRKVKYKGEEGRIIGGRGGAEASVLVSIRGITDAPCRDVTVPESEWGEFELLG